MYSFLLSLGDTYGMERVNSLDTTLGTQTHIVYNIQGVSITHYTQKSLNWMCVAVWQLKKGG